MIVFFLLFIIIVVKYESWPIFEKLWFMTHIWLKKMRKAYIVRILWLLWQFCQQKLSDPAHENLKISIISLMRSLSNNLFAYKSDFEYMLEVLFSRIFGKKLISGYHWKLRLNSTFKFIALWMFETSTKKRILSTWDTCFPVISRIRSNFFILSFCSFERKLKEIKDSIQ